MLSNDALAAGGMCRGAIRIEGRIEAGGGGGGDRIGEVSFRARGSRIDNCANVIFIMRV